MVTAVSEKPAVAIFRVEKMSQMWKLILSNR